MFTTDDEYLERIQAATDAAAEFASLQGEFDAEYEAHTVALKALNDANDLWLNSHETERRGRNALQSAIRQARGTMTLQEIADVLGVSRQRVDQISKGDTK